MSYNDDLGPSPTQGPSPIGSINRGMLNRIEKAGESQNPFESKAIQLLFKWVKEDIKI